MEFLNMPRRGFCKKITLFRVDILACVSVILIAARVASTICPPCLDDDIILTKSTCQEKGVFLEESQSSNNSTIVCSALHDLFICIAEHIPQCLGRVSSEYENYTRKPWDCSVDRYIQQYQAIVNSGCQLKEDYKPKQSGEKSGYKMVDNEGQNSTSEGFSISRHGCWQSLVVPMSLGLIFQLSDISLFDMHSILG